MCAHIIPQFFFKCVADRGSYINEPVGVDDHSLETPPSCLLQGNSVEAFNEFSSFETEVTFTGFFHKILL